MEDNFNLITGLKANLKNIFSLNDCLDSNIQKCFKVLIFDDHVFEVLTPLLKVYSLREENICLHLNIKTIKEKMPNVMGIYLIEPSKQNFSLIEKDIKNLIFDNYYFVFTNTLTEEQTIDFFSLLYNGNCAEKVYKIESYPMGIMTYHSRIFSLNIKSSYHFLNSSNVKESEVNEYFKLVGSGLFNLLFTLNSIPTIKYRQGWFAENIIQELQNIFDYSFEKFPETKNKMQSRSDTLLVILSRETDLPIMLYHPESLGGIMQDIFGVSTVKKNTKSTNSPLEIDPVEDYIWNDYISSSYFDKVEQVITNELKKIDDETKFLDNNPMNNLQKQSEEDLSKLSEKMSSTLDNFKDIQLKKNILTNYAKYNKEIFSEVTKRFLGPIHTVEKSLLCRRSYSDENKKEFYEILKEEKFKINKDNENMKLDILRMALIYYLTNQDLNTDEFNLIDELLKGLKIDISALHYLKAKRDFSKSMSLNKQPQNETLLKKGFSYLYNRVGGMITENNPSQLSGILSNLAAGKEESNFVEYSLLTKEKKNSKNSFSKIIVFICGGGSLVEFENIDEFMIAKGKQVIFLYRLCMDQTAIIHQMSL